MRFLRGGNLDIEEPATHTRSVELVALDSITACGFAGGLLVRGSFPIAWQAGLRVSKDVEYRGAILGWKASELLAGVFPAQDVI